MEKKKEYKKPVVSVVRMDVKQSVLDACKLPSQLGPELPGCDLEAGGPCDEHIS